MSVSFWTSDATALLRKFDSRIAQSDPKGKIETWLKHSDGVHYTHASAQWKSKAFFRPTTYNDRLLFNIINPKDKTILTPVYGYYHGHLTETFLNHFDDSFSTAGSSAQCTTGDLCG